MTILEEARQAADGPRRDLYGHPADNHGCTADLWRAYLRRRYGVTLAFLDAHDVAMLNALQKVSREANVRSRDNLVDLAGYAYNAELASERPGPWEQEADSPPSSSLPSRGPDPSEAPEPRRAGGLHHPHPHSDAPAVSASDPERAEPRSPSASRGAAERPRARLVTQPSVLSTRERGSAVSDPLTLSERLEELARIVQLVGLSQISAAFDVDRLAVELELVATLRRCASLLSPERT